MPLFMFSIASDGRALARNLSAVEKDQLPFAKSQTANRLARQGIADLKVKEAEVFDRPTSYALNAWYWRKASKRSPTAEIRAKDSGGKGTPAWKFLDPEVFGGSRRMKRFELALAARFGTGYAVPGSGAKLDRFGNMSRGDVMKILSALGVAEQTAGYSANRTERSLKRRGKKLDTFFLAHSKMDGTPLGIYRVVSAGKVVPVLIFPQRAPGYTKRLPYESTVGQAVTRNAKAFLTEELTRALATAKP